MGSRGRHSFFSCRMTRCGWKRGRGGCNDNNLRGRCWLCLINCCYTFTFFFLSSNQFSHYYNDIIVYHVKIIQRQFYWTCFLPNLLLLGWMICDRAIKKTWAAFQSGIISYFQLACNENEKIARFVNPWRERIWNGYKGVDVLRQQLVLHVPIQQHITIVF